MTYFKKNNFWTYKGTSLWKLKLNYGRNGSDIKNAQFYLWLSSVPILCVQYI